MNPVSSRIELSFASKADRASIYDIRYQVYASELGQHSENEYGMLTDKLDAVNYYIVAKLSGQIVGFVSVTPPNSLGYSIDKYFERENLPLIFDQNLYEIRLLTVVNKLRGSRVGALLCYAALCLIVSLKGKMIVAIGRLEILDLYFQAGMKSLDRQVRSGKVTYELLVAATNDIKKDPRLQKLFSYLEKKVIWKLDGVSFLKNDCCYHGGAFFEALDDEFADMQKKENVINAVTA